MSYRYWLTLNLPSQAVSRPREPLVAPEALRASNFYTTMLLYTAGVAAAAAAFLGERVAAAAASNRDRAAAAAAAAASARGSKGVQKQELAKRPRTPKVYNNFVGEEPDNFRTRSQKLWSIAKQRLRTSRTTNK